MNCHELRRYLDLHLDSELSSETAADLQRHLDGCAACAERLEKEERLEKAIRSALRKPDAEAWDRAVASLPGRRRWWIPAAAAVVLAAVAGFLLLRPHRELDLAASMSNHHVKYLGGGSELGVVTTDPSEASKYFEGKLAFASGAPTTLPADVRLVGARLCYLDGAPAAFYVFHRNGGVVTMAVFAENDLARFPVAKERLRSGLIHCRVEGRSFVAASGRGRAVAAVGDVPPEELERLVRSFVAE